MRVFALSDIHVDYETNASWVRDLSAADYQADVLILAGDVTDSERLLAWSLSILAKRFRKVLFVPGNHELWVIREPGEKNSLQKFEGVSRLVESSGATMHAYCEQGISVIPLLFWYDYSFGEPSSELRATWLDYHACRWPDGYQEKDIAAHFAAMNNMQFIPNDGTVITYSHFVPRLDLLPGFIPRSYRRLFPVLGSVRLDADLRRLRPSIHVFGHSHINCNVTVDGITYINNAFGYPREAWMTSKRLMCIHEC